MRYIGADKLIDEIKPFGEYSSNRRSEDWIKLFETAVRNQPTADVRENVRGKWVNCGIHGDRAWEQDGHGNFCHIWKCSKCEYTTEYCGNFCPKCGAQMER